MIKNENIKKENIKKERRYVSASFADICGNERIIKHMKASITNGTVTHAYIISGEKGMGKKSVSFAFAKSLQCQNPQGGASCGVCISCKTFDSGNNPDIIYVRPEKTKAVGIDDIRNTVGKNMETKPYLYKYKIFIIDGDMTAAAQNALLKTLEEPASYGIFLLLSNNAHSFLPTILSRSVVFHLKPLDINLVKQTVISRLGIDGDKAHFCAVYSQGNIGRALNIAANETFLEIRRQVTDILYNCANKGISDILTAAKQLEEQKDSISDILDIMIMWFRDIMIYSETRDDSMILQQDIKTLIIDESSRHGVSDVLNKLDAVMRAKLRISQNASLLLALEVLLLDILPAQALNYVI